MSDDVLAELPSSGMMLVKPDDCLTLLQLCTVMNWRPKIPLHIMRDASAGRWFMKGSPGQQDYWIRDSDIEVLMKTPMWPSVALAEPYGIIRHTTATEVAARMEEGLKKFPKVERDDALDMYVALAKAARDKPLDYVIIDDVDDPVERERAEAAKARLAAEERLKKLDEWE